MAKSEFKSVDEYIGSQPEAVQVVLVAAFKKELASYKISKGTIRFPLSEPVPVKLIERIAKFRAREVAERENKPSPKK